MEDQKKIQVLIVDDNIGILKSIRTILGDKEYDIYEARCSRGARKIIEENNLDIGFIDIDLEKPKAGFQLIEILKSKNIYSCLISGHIEDDYIERGYDLKFDRYLTKPFTFKQIKEVINKFSSQEKKRKFWSIIEKKFPAKDEYMTEQLHNLEKCIGNNSHLSITGPKGTGKLNLAKIFHVSLDGSENNFSYLDCGSLSEKTFNDEIFGHKKGLRNQTKERNGKLVKANGGILYLDNVEKMNDVMQTKLVNAIDMGYVIPEGGTSENKVHFELRLIVATAQGIDEGFRLEKLNDGLYHKVQGIEITIPSLEERPDDRKALVHSKIAQLKTKKAYVFDEKAIDALCNYSWFGNLTELDEYFRSLESIDRPIITYSKLPKYIRENINKKINRKETVANGYIFNMVEKIGYRKFKEKLEIDIIDHFYKKYDFNKSEVKRFLGMTQHTLNKNLKIMSEIDK